MKKKSFQERFPILSQFFSKKNLQDGWEELKEIFQQTGWLWAGVGILFSLFALGAYLFLHYHWGLD